MALTPVNANNSYKCYVGSGLSTILLKLINNSSSDRPISCPYLGYIGHLDSAVKNNVFEYLNTCVWKSVRKSNTQFCEPMVKGKTMQVLQLLFETLHKLQIIFIEHASRVRYTEFWLAHCLPDSENLNGTLVFLACTFRFGLYKQIIFFLHTFGRSSPEKFILS